MLDIYRKVEQRSNEEIMQVSKAGTRALVALLMDFSAQLSEVADELENASAFDVDGMVDVFSQAIEGVREIASECDSKYEKLEAQYLRELV